MPDTPSPAPAEPKKPSYLVTLADSMEHLYLGYPKQQQAAAAAMVSAFSGDENPVVVLHGLMRAGKSGAISEATGAKLGDREAETHIAGKRLVKFVDTEDIHVAPEDLADPEFQSPGKTVLQNPGQVIIGFTGEAGDALFFGKKPIPQSLRS